MRTPEEVLSLLAERRRNLSVPFGRMQQIRDVYNSDIAVPLPELGQNQQVAIANMANVGIDQYGMRIASVMPNIWFPPVRPGIKKSEEAARDRRYISYGWWEKNRIKRKMGRRSRRFVAYGAAPVNITWDAKWKMPRWDLQDPLGTFPAPSHDPDEIHPDDCIFVFRQPARWLRENYAEQYRKLRKGSQSDDSKMIELVRYVDADQQMLIACGAKGDAYSTHTDDGTYSHVLLENVPNRAGVCTAVTPGRVTLDRPMGQFDAMIGMYLQEAEFSALAVIANRKAIFPDLWLVDGPNSQAKIVKVANGLTGEVGRVSGGQLVPINPQAGYLTNPTQDRMREDQRMTAGIPGDMTGQGNSSIRTGRRGSQLFSAVVDFPVQEAQEVFADAAMEELKIGIALDKAYSDSAPKSVFVAWKGSKGRVDYVPKDLWEDDEVTVNYAFAGTDTNGLVIEGGQRLGMDTMSKQSFMEIDPLVADAEVEMERIEAEGLRQALLQQVQTVASQPGGPYTPRQLAEIVKMVVTDREELFEAIAKIDDQIKEQQAAAAQAATGPPTADQMPGLDGAAPTTIADPAASQPSAQHLSELLNNLRRPQRQTPAEMASVTG